MRNPTPNRARITAAMAAGLLLLSACGDARSDPSPDDAAAAPAPVSIRSTPSPAGPGTAEPNLAVGEDGVWLSWLEPTTDDRHALRLARWDGSGWDSTRTVLERPDLFVNWADFPSVLALEDGTLAAHWLEKSGPGTYAYDVRVALSRDDGRTWSEDIIPHRDGIQAEHGFVSMLPVDGRIGLVWLDGRATVRGEPMTLRYTTIDPAAPADEALGEEVLLDAGVCDCCQTGAAMTADGPVVVYRDRTEGEVRDIRITRKVGEQWTEPRLVHEDGWVIDACPVNGPSVAAEGERVVVAWFTGAKPPAEEAAASGAGSGGTAGAASGTASPSARSAGRVLAAFSEDAGATFSEPVRVDGGSPMGRADVVLLDDGSALVAWLERIDGAAEVRVRRVEPDGRGAAVSLAPTAAERSSGFPRMVRAGDRILFAWTEAGEGGGVKTAVGRLAPSFRADLRAPTAALAVGAGAGVEGSR